MDNQAARFVTTTPALPCHVCGTLTTTARIEHRDDDRWILLPVCAVHQVRSTQGGAPENG
jgi:hypothetical protein